MARYNVNIGILPYYEGFIGEYNLIGLSYTLVHKKSAIHFNRMMLIGACEALQCTCANVTLLSGVTTD